MELLIDFGVPVSTALISGIITYFVAAKSHNMKLKETKLTLEQEIATLEKRHQQKLETLEKEVELHQKSKENDVMLDVMGKFMEGALDNPQTMGNLMKLSEEVSKFKK